VTELQLPLDHLTDQQVRILIDVARNAEAHYAADDPGIADFFVAIRRAAQDELVDRKAGTHAAAPTIEIVDRDAADPTDASRVLPSVADALEAVALSAPIDLFGTFGALALNARDAIRPRPH